MSKLVPMALTKRSNVSVKRQGHRNQVRIDVYDVVMRFSMALNTPRSLKLYLLLKNREYSQIASFGVNPIDYTDGLLPFLGLPGLAAFAADYQCANILAKYEGLDTGIDTELAAIRKFISCELTCKETNDRLRDDGFSFAKRDIASVISLTQRKIATILGDVPEYSEVQYRFGPGANYGVRGETSSYNKLTSALECTYPMVDCLAEFLGEFPGWFPEGSIQDVSLVSGSRLTFVPKNAKTDRPICIEPLLNGLYQKGVGSYIRNRLKRFGYDLTDQSVNQLLAKRAIVDHLATVDFSSASDTISYNVVLGLLPIEWFQMLDTARSPSFEFQEKVYPFQKFSSMGNGYTFELESLIFATLAESCCEVLGLRYSLSGDDRNLSVYGDDVIIPSAAFRLFSEVTSSLGFLINTEKTFTWGLFFESCGKDYFLGTDVRPFFIKTDPNKRGELGVMYVANSIKRWANKFSEIDPLGRSNCHFAALFSRIVDLIPCHRRLYGPDGFGDGHFLADTCDLSFPSKNGWEGYFFSTRVEVPKLHVPRGAEGNSTIAWPMSYALYNSAYGSNSVKEFYQSLYDVKNHTPGWWRSIIESDVSHSLGFAVRGRTSVKKVLVHCFTD